MNPWTVPRLHLITDPVVCPFEQLCEWLPRLLQAGVDAVHLRAPGVAAGELLKVAAELRRLIVPPAVLLVNDRLDLALLCQADGVHLPEQGLPVWAARELLGRGRVVGRSVHSVEAARAAAAEGCDYLLYGNVYETASKPGAAARGLDALRAVVHATHVPIVAIGGITPDRVPAVVRMGAHGVAVIRGILAADDPVAAVRAYRRAMDEVRGDGNSCDLKRETGRAGRSADHR
ncbi:thiamine phosphate synthase [Thermomicrobium sp. CFH 73360]|uniref:thiamine phosphate synthase n=1 Tax=Thermomicrobium sp. CFH 73360 TaxID=2951987 RepID=UPI002076B003|nr:thiamine phosphate synthase [Thermomicrobium sp. CFH 73360]MCM8745587.1 thiamine phosphate synthase [Thermomicrobium sp. CFH 73360]